MKYIILLVLFLLFNCVENTINIKKVMFTRPNFDKYKKNHKSIEVCADFLSLGDDPRGRRLRDVLKRVELEFPKVDEWYDVEVVNRNGCLIFFGDYYEK